MSLSATNENGTGRADRIAELKQANESQPVHPFFSRTSDSAANDTYKYATYKPRFPVVDWEPLKEIDVTDRGHSADPEKKALFGAAKKVQHLAPAIGTEITGIDLRQLTPAQKDELALLVAERGVVFFRDQEMNIYEQLDLGRYFGPLHKHASTPVPKEPGLEAIHVLYNDAALRPDFTTFSQSELWHSDVSYEIQPPGTTSIKMFTSPEYGGDTMWSSGYGLYSSLSPGFQTYLEGLSALHSAVDQANNCRAAGLHVRRKPVETIHPVVRVHPVTGWKSVYVNPGFTRRIVGVPKAESNFVLDFLFQHIRNSVDFQVRFRWEPNSIGFWDNRIVIHSAIYDFWPQQRHALRVTPHGERPESVRDYEQRTGKVAKDRQIEIWKQQGIEPSQVKSVPRVSGYND